MDGKQLKIGDQDLARVEGKINSALQHRLASRTGEGAKQRIKGLHKFLEEAEGADSMMKSRDTLYSKQSMSSSQKNGYQTDAQALIREQEYLGSLAQAKTNINTLTIELNSTKQDLDAVRKVLEEERAATKQREAEVMSQLSANEQEFSTQITDGLSRQQETIAKLLADKQSLSEQVSSLASQLRMSDSKAKSVVDELKAKFRQEMRDAQTQWLAIEKAKRDKWKTEKEKEIKEMTIRGLEPEVERMLSKQREEKTKMESETAEQLRKEKAKLESEYTIKIEELKQRILSENEGLLTKEKEFMKQHFEALTKEASNSAIKQAQDMDSKWRREMEEERIKRIKESEYWESRLQCHQKESLEHVARIKSEFDDERKEWKARVESERRRVIGVAGEEERIIKKRLEADLEREYKRKAEEAKTQAMKERDDQIQMIIGKLLKEKAEEIEQAIQNERSKVKQKKSQIEADLGDLRTELTVYKERLLEEKAKQTKLIDENLAKDRSVDNLLKENEDQRQQIVKLKARIRGLEEECESHRVTIKAMEKSFNSQLDLEKRKAYESRKEVHELMIQSKQEKEMIVRELEEKQISEIESLETRIKGVLDRKEREVQDLREEICEKEAICLKYEQLLEKQRRELLTGFG